MGKPILTKDTWYKGKTPTLRINILKEVLNGGQISKSKYEEISNSFYSDISHAIDYLQNTNGFIVFTKKDFSSRKKPANLYNLTKEGLKALLDISLKPNEFWKIVILLVLSNKKNNFDFEKYYNEFENDILGFSSTKDYFYRLFPIKKITFLLDAWINHNYSAKNAKNDISIQHRILECLAINRNLTLEQIAEKIKVTKDDLNLIQDIKILENYPVSEDVGYIPLIINKNKKNENDIPYYELSLFGIMVVLTIIKHYHIGLYELRLHHTTSDINIFLNYFDIIAKNYKDKLPFIFGKWDILKEYLGSLLYRNFDFLIYKDGYNTFDSSVWNISHGNKEFFEEIDKMGYHFKDSLYQIYINAVKVFIGFQENFNLIDDTRITPIYNKINKLKKILKTIDIPHPLDGYFDDDKKVNDIFNKDTNKNELISLKEDAFRDGLSFLFYINLNTSDYPLSKDELEGNISKSLQENSLLGEPNVRLFKIILKDKEIRRWFSQKINEIIEYRHTTTKRMDKFYEDVINIKKDSIAKLRQTNTNLSQKGARVEVYDPLSICSSIIE